MRRAPLILALTLALAVVAAAPLASAGPEIPPEKVPQCHDVLGRPKCDAIRDEVEDLFTCTCPPW